ncbi:MULTISPECIES: hypothetical protein [Streptomyces]|uniref:hypothetical protein n=1 Tax=Streptomyces TaxID=1883 RepID=UPI00292F3204|nr:hypothetical protein [Streptomyces sp. NEAU-HV9]
MRDDFTVPSGREALGALCTDTNFMRNVVRGAQWFFRRSLLALAQVAGAGCRSATLIAHGVRRCVVDVTFGTEQTTPRDGRAVRPARSERRQPWTSG